MVLDKFHVKVSQSKFLKKKSCSVATSNAAMDRAINKNSHGRVVYVFSALSKTPAICNTQRQAGVCVFIKGR